jgi:phenylacetate-CoA ligase
MTRESSPERRALEAGQLSKLRALLKALVPANSFYAQKLAQAGLVTRIPASPGTAAAELSSLDEFAARMPFTLKSEIVEDQRAHPPYGTNLTHPIERYTRFCQTSGTSGQPLRWLDTAESWSWLLDNWSVVYRAAGVKPADRIFFAFSFGPFLGFWTAFEAATQLGMLAIPGGGLSSEARLQLIHDNRVDVLCCTPTYAIRLGEVAQRDGIDFGAARVRTIIVAGEPGGSIPATRAQIERLWPGARVFDHHGMTEVGPVTYECPEKPGTLCVIESSYFAEVIDPASGEPVAEGATGELVLTTLGRTGSPLLRYRTGDLVKRVFVKTIAQDAPALALEGGILGRSDDMVIVRGVNVFPTALEHIIREHAGIAEYRVEISERDGMGEVSVLIEPAGDCADGAALARKLESALKTALALRIPVSIAPRASLPRFEMKAKRWVRV